MVFSKCILYYKIREKICHFKKINKTIYSRIYLEVEILKELGV